MPFGLVNAPSTSTRLGNFVFKDFLDKFVVLFVDDVLIYSRTFEEHIQHLHMVINRLHECEIFVNADKFSLFTADVQYLGLSISADGVSITENRKDAIAKWPAPVRTDLLANKMRPGKHSRNKDGKTGIRSFLGVVGFFRKFIKGFARLARPLTDLLKAEKSFQWEEEQQSAFEALKEAITNADVLQIPSPDPAHLIEVIPDASKVAIGGVLLQDQGHGMRPCAYFSRRISDSESTKAPYELELNALVALLRAWRPYLVGRKFVIRTDHSPLKQIPTQVKLTDKVIRQLDFLSEFTFEVLHIPGKDNTAADGLSRRPDHYWNEDGTRRFGSSSQEQESVEDTNLLVFSHDYVAYLRERLGGKNRHCLELTSLERELPRQVYSGSSMKIDDQLTVIASDMLLALLQDDTTIAEEIRSSYETDALAINLKDHPSEYPSYTQVGDLFYRKKLDGGKALYIPSTALVTNADGDRVSLRKQLCFECHDSHVAGHIGVNRMSALLRRSFFWPHMHIDIKEQIRECYECQKNKRKSGRTQGKYTPVLPPIRKWSTVSLDFITDLPLTSQGSDSIMVVMDTTTRRVHLIPYHMTFTAEDTARIYFKEVFRLHGLPDVFISDRDTRFTSKFWKTLWSFMGTKLAMTTSYHPQANAPNERSHLVIEEALRSLVQFPPTDWEDHLPVVEFVCNNSVNRDTGFTPFYLDQGQHPLDPVTLLMPRNIDAASENILKLVDCQRVSLRRA